VTLDARRARLWRAMELGPVWSLRAAAQPLASLPAPLAQSDGSVPLASAIAPAARAAAIAALDWTVLERAVADCTACPLARTRSRTVFGVGHRAADWMLVGEAPGAEEDARGEPFVGQAGRLLDNMLAAVGLTRAGTTPQSVYIANVLKCRPPGNRNPEPAEVACCEPFLQRQIALVQPKLVLVMGRFAAQSLLGTDASIASLRGRVHEIKVAARRVPVVVTYHPAYLLRNLADKAKSWADLCLARDVIARAAQR
jgi:uracil-DNA glycosylase family 4